MTRLTRVERLRILCDVWGRALLFHPAIVVGGPLDWAAAFESALSRVETAGDAPATAAAINDALLAKLNDPLSFAGVFPEADAGSPESTDRALSDDGRRIGIPPEAIGQPDFLSRLSNALSSRRDDGLIVLDLRWDRPYAGPIPCAFLGWWLHGSGEVTRTRRAHHGWHELPQPYVYSQRWERAPVRRVEPLAPLINAPTLVLVDNASVLHLDEALAVLQAAPNVRVAWQRTGRLSIPAGRALRYPGGIAVHLNVTCPPFSPDIPVPFHVSESAFADTYERAIRTEATRTMPRPGDAVLPRPAGGFAGAQALTRSERLMALAKASAVLEHCYPYFPSTSLAPGDVLRRWLEPIEAAESPEAYCGVLEEVLAALNDSHAALSHPAMRDAARPSVSVQMSLEHELPVVTEAWGSAPLQRGDAILEIDGRPFAEVANAWRARISASSDQAFYRDLFQRMWRGREGTLVDIACRRGGERHRVAVPREDVPPPTRRPRVRAAELALPGCGHAVDVTADRLGCLRPFDITSVRGLDVAMEMIRDAKGLLLDLRGYPLVHFQHALVRRLCDRPVESPLYEIPIATGADRPADRWDVIRYTVRAEDETPPPRVFAKPVVALIDERTQSSAEDLCMYLRIARRATFVGRPTAGCHGNAAFALLPGGACIRFTGMRVRWPDGSPFQGLGIVPDVSVAGDPVSQGLDVLRRLVTGT